MPDPPDSAEAMRLGEQLRQTGHFCASLARCQARHITGDTYPRAGQLFSKRDKHDVGYASELRPGGAGGSPDGTFRALCRVRGGSWIVLPGFPGSSIHDDSAAAAGARYAANVPDGGPPWIAYLFELSRLTLAE